MSFSRPNMSIPIASGTLSRGKQGSVYSSGDIETYQFDQENRWLTSFPRKLKTYAALDAEEKSSVTETSDAIRLSPAAEAVSIRGMVNIPVATDFNESKSSIYELICRRGDIAMVPEIDCCGFLSRVPYLNLDMSMYSPNTNIGKLPSLNEIVAGINGITLPTLEIESEAVTGIVGKISFLDRIVSIIGAAIQGNIPTIYCGKPETVPISQPPSQLGSALSRLREQAIEAAIAEIVPYGTNPNIVIESPDVTVKSLDDEIDSGEF